MHESKNAPSIKIPKHFDMHSNFLKVIYPKYSKHWLSTVAHTVDCVIESWFKSWVIIFTFQVFWVKKHFKLTWKFKIKILIPILFNISVLLDEEANLPETSPFFACPNGFGEHLFWNIYSTFLNFLCIF